MNTNTADSLARRPGLAIAGMVLLHLGLLLALSRTQVRPDPQAGEAPSPVWLLLSPRAAAPAEPMRAAAAPRVPAAARRSAPIAAPRTPPETTLFLAPRTPIAAPPNLAGSTGGTSDASSSTASTAAPGAEPPASNPLRPPPLDLRLPRQRSAQPRHPGLDDPRSNTRSLTLESRLAEVMGSSEGPITEEPMPDGSLRLRRGNTCVIVRPSRVGALDPFNHSVSPKPRQVDGC